MLASSAYKINLAMWLMPGRSFIYTTKSSGPRIDPCYASTRGTFAIHVYKLFSVAKVRSEPAVSDTSDSVLVELFQEDIMIHHVESL